MNRFDAFDLPELQQMLAAFELAERSGIFSGRAGFLIPAMRADLKRALEAQIEKIPQGYRTVGHSPGLPPICLSCHRKMFGVNFELPPPDPERRDEICDLCGGHTNYGLYLEVE